MIWFTCLFLASAAFFLSLIYNYAPKPSPSNNILNIFVYELHKRLLDDIELSNVTCDRMHESNVQIIQSFSLPF